MRYDIAPLSALLLGALVAQAAVTRPTIAQKWAVPVTEVPVIDYRIGSPGVDAPPPSPFEFDDHRPRGPVGQPPPRPNDRNVVLGLGLPWTDGRPPLDCAQTPMDAKCH
jgi:hypothetical protein